MAIERDDAEERAARIDQILEELRLNTEDMQDLARKAAERARAMREATRVVRDQALARHSKKATPKHR